MSNQPQPFVVQAPVAGLLTWIIPGLGHIYLGHRTRGVILIITITVTFWSGVAIGGLKETVNPQDHRIWFMAQIAAGGHTLIGYALHQWVERSGDPIETTHWLSADIGLHYAGVAGLLSLLIIFDAIAKSDPSASSRQRKDHTAEGVP